MDVSQITRNLCMGWAPASPARPQNVMRACDMHAAGNPTTGFIDYLDGLNSTIWSVSDGWANGVPFNCGWKSDHVTFSGGIMTLTLDNTPSNGKPYTSGEYRSNDFYGYGTVETRMKAAKVNGVMGGSIFTCTGSWDGGNPWDEIDIEFVKGKLQTNYTTNGVGGHETLIDLGFDPSTSFHTYKIEWLPNRINWYVDGVKIHSEDGSRGPLPTTPGRIMANLWPGDGTEGSWLNGPFVYSSPITAEYDYIRYTPYTPSANDLKVIAVPNPVNAGTGIWIKWPYDHHGKVEVRIYNVAGELINTLEQNNSYTCQIKWDLKNRQGSSVTRGLYVYAVFADGKKIGSGKIGIK